MPFTSLSYKWIIAVNEGGIDDVTLAVSTTTSILAATGCRSNGDAPSGTANHTKDAAAALVSAQTKTAPCTGSRPILSGEGGIRTRDSFHYARFRDESIQPLWHLSIHGLENIIHEVLAASNPEFTTVVASAEC